MHPVPAAHRPRGRARSSSPRSACEIDTLTDEQAVYRRSGSSGGRAPRRRVGLLVCLVAAGVLSRGDEAGRLPRPLRRRLGTVEINNSFYRLPTEETFAKWARTVPDGFRFSVKAPRAVSVFGRVDFVPDLNARVRSLGDRLGPMLVRLADRRSATRTSSLKLMEALDDDLEVALDFRDPSWDGSSPSSTPGRGARQPARGRRAVPLPASARPAVRRRGARGVGRHDPRAVSRTASTSTATSATRTSPPRRPTPRGWRACAGSVRRDGRTQASVDKMQREASATRRAGLRALLRAAARGRDGHAPRGGDRAGRGASPTPTTCPTRPRPAARSTRPSCIKLNGGLGTSMGMTGAKSLLEVKDGLTFLDIIARQVLELRERTGARLPLVLMNSFATRDDSLEALEPPRELAADVPARLRPEQGAEAARRRPRAGRVARRPGARVGPPGHGDVYTALHDLRHARRAARARLPLGVPLELRQPRRGARPAHPGLDRARGAPVRDGGRRPHARPTARAATSRAGATAPGSCCARPRRRPRRTSTRSRTSTATATSTRTTCGSTSRRCDGCSPSATACSGCR